VRPPWEPARSDALDVVIDPGQAFGTGAHPSTRLTLELLTQLPPSGPLADWGCGSGVLAIAAAKLGFDPVLACDIEEASLEATAEAARANGVAIQTTRCDLRRAPGPWAPVVLANLVGPLLLELASHLGDPPRDLIVSGVEAHEADDIAGAFGLRESGRRTGDGWTAIHLRA
jgi:ribosomal protein L11 methyltransferase